MVSVPCEQETISAAVTAVDASNKSVFIAMIVREFIKLVVTTSVYLSVLIDASGYSFVA